MKRYLLTILLIIGAFCVSAQPGRTYTDLKQVKDPLQVYSLKLSFKRLKQVPVEIREMKNLEVLDLSKNYIDTLPSWIGELTQLKEVDVSRNWLHYLPEELGGLSKLESLDANRNPLQELPASMGSLAALRQLILWQTGIVELPPSAVMLNTTLKVLDLRACQLTQEDQETITDLLPDVKKVWDQACNCSR